MSDLLNSASLVMIPSGYKEDTVYSVVPSDGSGDLSFTRASNGTRINSGGLVEVCPWNLLENSENFGAIWGTTAGASITANTTTAPNGTLTADTFSVSTSNYSTLYQAFSLSLGAYSQSIYAKKSTKNWLYILNLGGGSGKAWFNLDTGVVGTVISGFTATIESVGDGWYRCVLTQNTNVAPIYYQFGLSDADNTTQPSSTGTAFIWGAQLNIGSTAKPYFPTTDRLNVPRLTYQNGGGGCPSLLLEKQSTNLVTYSEQFDNAAWTKDGSTTSANNTTSPDGTQNADKIVENTANSGHGLYAPISNTSGQQYTVSVYAKAAERNWFVIYVGGGPAQGRFFDLSNGVLGSVLANTPNASSITNTGNGWYRCSITYTATDTSSEVDFLMGSSDGTNTYTGNGTNGLYIWGAQAEAGSYPTSYIPTTSSSATRVADACSKTGISSLIGQTEGTLFVEVINKDFTTFERFVAISSGSTSNRIILLRTTNNELYFYVEKNGSMVFDAVITNAAITGNNLLGNHKIAIAYKSGLYALYIDGVSYYTNTNTNVPACSAVYFGTSEDGVLTNTLNGNIKQGIVFPTRLTNAELASLTTI